MAASTIDFNLCIICQVKTADPLLCPLESAPYKRDFSYSPFLERIGLLEERALLDPCHKHLAHVKEEELRSNKAKWHAKCKVKFSESRIQRTEERARASISSSTPSPRVKRQSVNRTLCVFCQGSDPERSMSTMSMDQKVRQMAHDMEDSRLMAIFAEGDAVAIEAKYHLKCYTAYQRCHRKKKGEPDEDEDEILKSRTFEQLVAYVETEIDSGNDFFSLSELAYLYETKLKSLGFRTAINRTRFKIKLLSMLEHHHLREELRGKCIYLIGDRTMTDMVIEMEKKKKATSKEFHVLAEAAAICRREAVGWEIPSFNGDFPEDCQEKSVPESLKFLLQMIIEGPSAIRKDASQQVLTSSQVVLHNMKQHDRRVHHSPPLMIYIGLKIYSMMRSKSLITILSKLGVSTSYKKVMSVQNQLANSIAKQAEVEGVVCPRIMKKGVFTVGAGDNIDHNPSSTTSTDSFHGTAVSMFQMNAGEAAGEARPLIKNEDNTISLDLPDHYRAIQSLEGKVLVRKSTIQQEIVLNLPQDLVQQEFAKEERWVHNVIQGLEQGAAEIRPWSVHHAAGQSEPVIPGVGALLPMFYDKSTDPRMIKHCMYLIQKGTAFLNPGQIPVITFDQPLYAHAKTIQWTFPECFGEDRFVVMMGGLHTEKALWTAVGDLLHSSGWTEKLVEAEVITPGSADACLKVAHITKTRGIHQLSVAALSYLLQKAFEESGSENLESWIQEQKSPTFRFWFMVRKYELLILMFVRAHREKNFDLYVKVLEELIPLFFITGHVNYARWGSVHSGDMRCLPKSTLDEFQKGNWVVSKTNRRFSALPTDQAHEQLNKSAKAEGGVIGITCNQAAMDRWTMVSPETSRAILQFEDIARVDSISVSILHHEETPGYLCSFTKRVSNLVSVLMEGENPFSDTSTELFTLDNKVCVGSEPAAAILNFEQKAKQLHDDYQKHFDPRTKISSSKISLFRATKPRKLKAVALAAKSFKQTSSLMGQLWITAQIRETNLEEIFQHESESCPPALSDGGKLYATQKSQLIQEISGMLGEDQEDRTDDESLDQPTYFDTIILDGGNTIHKTLPRGNISTFKEYSEVIFLPSMRRLLRNCSRLDLIWDTYSKDSLKEGTRLKRGTGLRQQVKDSAKLPRNWNDFLKDSQNKTELFNFLSEEVSNAKFPEDKTMYVTSGTSVLRSGTGRNMPECSHEEADTRVVVHLLHAVEGGSPSVLIKTGDTDVVVILLGHIHRLEFPNEVWICFGSGKDERILNLGEIGQCLGPEKCRAIPVFHALTGCDTTSAFRFKGKSRCFATWKKNNWFTEHLYQMAQNPFKAIDESVEKGVEKFVCKLYGGSSSSSDNDVNSLRRIMFGHKTQDLRWLPPTKDSLQQHLKRVNLQASIWVCAHVSQLDVVSPDEFGWMSTPEGWKPVWNTIGSILSLSVRTNDQKG